MVLRSFWLDRIKMAWAHSSIIWLQGVRRTGKTTMAKAIPGALYFNCDLPSVQEELKHPEAFLKNVKEPVVIFDEIHQLAESSMILKIAADEFSHLKVLATGSSSLIAGKKFKDTLTGRKRNIHLVPVLIQELGEFDVSLEKRLLYGGLPPALLSGPLDSDFYGEWLDSFYARDIQELFAVEKRQPFLKALEYLLVQNGNQFDATKLAQVSGVSRPTLMKYLDILDVTNAITILRPFSRNPEQEIVSQPKIYGFDTGFSCFAQGIDELGPQEKGRLLENLCLETLQAYGLSRSICYWRTKQKKEVDFVLDFNRNKQVAVECKWQERNVSSDGIESFRKNYPHGENWVVTSNSRTRIEKDKNLSLRFINVRDFPTAVSALRSS